jgi:DNA-binding NarL/FixJ family response regulator
MERAVFDPLPLFRLGMLASLGGGDDLGSLADLSAWLEPRRPAMLLLTLQDTDDDATLHESTRHPDVLVVAVLSTFTVAAAARALRDGASHVVARDSDPELIRKVVAEVEAGVVRLPLAVVRAAMGQPRSGGNRPDPSDDEIAWLRALASGRSVAEVALQSAISERRLYRRLSDLYRRLGVANRTQALMVGRDEGWL